MSTLSLQRKPNAQRRSDSLLLILTTGPSFDLSLLDHATSHACRLYIYRIFEGPRSEKIPHLWILVLGSASTPISILARSVKHCPVMPAGIVQSVLRLTYIRDSMRMFLRMYYPEDPITQVISRSTARYKDMRDIHPFSSTQIKYFLGISTCVTYLLDEILPQRGKYDPLRVISLGEFPAIKISKAASSVFHNECPLREIQLQDETASAHLKQLPLTP